MNIRILFITLLLLATGTEGICQFYSTGQDPSSLKWKQVETESFRLIFPESFSPRAAEYAQLLEQSLANARELYPGTRGRVPVIIHSYSMQSNGYLSWAPGRIELYPLPGQVNQPDDPSQLLIMHEVTHFAEISSLNYGFTRILNFCLGEQATGIAAATLPLWALEGDAVYAETRFSNSGRGRSNDFMSDAKAIALSSSGNYSYDKMLFGSYRDFTPDHYVFGYQMMNYLRTNYPEFWKENVDFSGRNLYVILPTNYMLRKKLGINKNKLYKMVFDSLAVAWQSEEENFRFTGYKSLNPDKNGDYINYHSPFITDDGKIIALKTSFTKPRHFVLIDTTTHSEKDIFTPGYLSNSIFTYSPGKIVWAEYHPDIRWENLDYSVIKTLDIKTGICRQLTHKTRYSAPSLSADGTLIAAVNNNPDITTNLVIINAEDGSVVDESTPPGGIYLQRPSWSVDNSFITAVSLSSQGEGLIKYSLADKKWNYILAPSHIDITSAEPAENGVYILCQDSISNNIYFSDNSGCIKQVSHSRFGISSFSHRNNKLCISDNTVSGYNIASIDEVSSEDLQNATPSYLTTSCQPDTVVDYSTGITEYEIKPYTPAFHLFRFHSWAPFYYNPSDLQTNPEEIGLGFTLLSQNDLSTLISTIGYEFKENLHTLHSTIKWQGWYPTIEADVSTARNNFFSYPADESYFSSDIEHYTTLNLNIYLPLYFSYSRFYQYIMPAIYISYINECYYDYGSKVKEEITLLKPRIYFSNIHRTAVTDIYPRWGQIIDIQASLAPFDSETFRPLKGFRSQFYFPSFASGHGIKIGIGYESQAPLIKGIMFNINSFPRGYGSLVSAKMTTFTSDYTLPLFYPDFSAGSFLYLKRIRCTAFYDRNVSKGTYSMITYKYNPDTEIFSSLGGELTADFFILRIPYEISAGIRTGYKPEEKRYFAESILSVNIYGSVLGRNR